MNGATTVPWLSTIKDPRASMTNIIGANQNFLRSLNMRHKSLITSNINTSPQNVFCV